MADRVGVRAEGNDENARASRHPSSEAMASEDLLTELPPGPSATRPMGRPGRLPRRSAETLLWLTFVLCAGYALRVGYAMHLGAKAQLARQANTTPNTPPGVNAPVRAHRTSPSFERLGTLEIPALRLSVPVFEGDDTPSLTRGLGHIPTTAMPGGLGTMALAGHRDTYLRPLEHSAPHMEIRVSGATGLYHYVVDSTEIVSPDAVHVLDIADRPELVLITCYPFHYIGPAPMRFIVHAHLVSILPG